ncbi:MAG TPA: FeoA family protein [Anaerolineales bacterium]
MPPTNKISLAQLPAHAFATILSLASGRLETFRLVSLGFTPGARVAIAQNYGRGPLIVMVRGTRIALGRGEAARIFVQPTPQ